MSRNLFSLSILTFAVALMYTSSSPAAAEPTSSPKCESFAGPTKAPRYEEWMTEQLAAGRTRFTRAPTGYILCAW